MKFTEEPTEPLTVVPLYSDANCNRPLTKGKKVRASQVVLLVYFILFYLLPPANTCNQRQQPPHKPR